MRLDVFTPSNVVGSAAGNVERVFQMREIITITRTDDSHGVLPVIPFLPEKEKKRRSFPVIPFLPEKDGVFPVPPKNGEGTQSINTKLRSSR